MFLKGQNTFENLILDSQNHLHFILSIEAEKVRVHEFKWIHVRVFKTDSQNHSALVSNLTVD